MTNYYKKLENLKKELTDYTIQERDYNALQVFVIDYILDEFKNYKTNERSDAVKGWFNDLLTHGGCSSGMISGLIYYKDTYAFFDKYYQEILELYHELDDGAGVFDDIKNDLAWFGFEETARWVAGEIGLEY